MATDPIMAARLAAQAAAAAKAAADAAAAAAAEAAAAPARTWDGLAARPSDLSAPAVVESSLGDDLIDDVRDQLPAEQFSNLADRVLPEAGDLRIGGLLDLPQLGQLADDLSAFGAATGSRVDMDLTFTDPGGGMDQSIISDGSFGYVGKPLPAGDWKVSTSTGPIWTPDGQGGGSLLEGSERTFKRTTGDHVDTRTVTMVRDKSTGTRTVTTVDYDGTRTVEHFDSDGKAIADEDWNRGEPQSDDNEPVFTTGVTAKDVTDFVDGLFGGDDDAETTDTGEGDGAGTPGVAKPVPDENGGGGGGFSAPPGGPDLGGLLTGVTGHTTGGADSPNAPNGGNTVINYGSEGGPISGKPQGPLRDVRAANLVGQPVPDDDAAPLDPAKLQGLSVLPGPEVINPDSGEQANASTQASTAYRAPDVGGASMSDKPDDLASDPTGSLDDPMDDPIAAMASDGDDGSGGRDGGGRDFGQSHGQGHGHDDRRKDEDDPGD